MTDGKFPTSSRPSFGKLKKQFEELRHCLEELGSLCPRENPWWWNYLQQLEFKFAAQKEIWNETWLAGFFFQPCNHELFVKHTLNMEMAIVMAREAGVDWIIHLDTDELMHPAGTSCLPTLSKHESNVERDDVKEPFSEVSMFKKNYDHLTKEMYFGNYKEATRGNPNYFLTYGNGKSAARVQGHMRSNGAHRWHNYMKSPNPSKGILRSSFDFMLVLVSSVECLSFVGVEFPLFPCFVWCDCYPDLLDPSLE
ncbi:hypothetical protein KY290_011032 [Solanum tuberosum]|uniref:Uncharacterized protein n=1 Tax=Solanum tuberosum TaxID=4113 RepID=A0ABQ7W1H2_SOLTU|nr:hypothetical protein KY290_011032 [Solanum tuberosum]